jgi:hypothetical protein
MHFEELVDLLAQGMMYTRDNTYNDGQQWMYFDSLWIELLSRGG